MNATTNETRSVKVSWTSGYLQPRGELVISVEQFQRDYARRDETLEQAIKRTNTRNWDMSYSYRFEVIG